MQVEKSHKAKPRRKIKVRIFKLLLAIVVVLIVSAFFLIPAFVSSKKGRKIISARINSSINGKVDFADLSMSWFKGIKVTDVSFTCGRANDSSGQISVAVKQTTIKPSYHSILLGRLSFKAELAFERAEYMGLNFGPTKVSVRFRNGFLDISPFSTAVNNGQFNFAGQADFGRQPALLKITESIRIIQDIQIDDETAGRFLAYVNPVFANAVNVSGVLNFNCERLTLPLAAGKNDIEVIGTISIEKIRLQSSELLGRILSLTGIGMRGQDITIHPTRFVLRNGFLRYDNMQMDIGNNPVNFKGAIGLDKSLDMTVTLPYTLAGRTARIGKEPIGERISLPLKGTIDKPKLDLGKLLEEQLKQQLEKQLNEKLLEQLDKLFE